MDQPNHSTQPMGGAGVGQPIASGSAGAVEGAAAAASAPTAAAAAAAARPPPPPAVAEQTAALFRFLHAQRTTRVEQPPAQHKQQEADEQLAEQTAAEAAADPATPTAADAAAVQSPSQPASFPQPSDELLERVRHAQEECQRLGQRVEEVSWDVSCGGGGRQRDEPTAGRQRQHAASSQTDCASALVDNSTTRVIRLSVLCSCPCAMAISRGCRRRRTRRLSSSASVRSHHSCTGKQ